MSDRPRTAKERLAIIAAEIEQDSLAKSAEALVLARRSQRLDTLARVLSEAEACRLLARLVAGGLVSGSESPEPVNTVSKPNVSN